MWRNNTVRNVKAAGGTWITKMFDKIKMDSEGNKIPRLCDQTKDYDYTSTEFMKQVVTLAAQAGRSFKDDQPASNANVKKNFDSVENDIQSFGAQIAKAAPREKHNIFNQNELMEFPLSPILEWHALYCSYDPHLNTDPS
eukprot:2939861-Rhodomonas_salina.1